MARDLRRPILDLAVVLSEPGSSAAPSARDLLPRSGTGTFTVSIGRAWTDKLLARLAGHRSSGQVRTSLTVTPLSHGGERWIRSFGGHEIASTVVWSPDADRFTELYRGTRLEFRTIVATEGVRAELCSVGIALGPFTVPLPIWAFPAVTCRTRLATTRPGEARPEVVSHVEVTVRARRGRPVLSYEGVLS